MWVAPTCSVRHHRYPYGLYPDQPHSRVRAQIFTFCGQIQLSCKIAWQAEFMDGTTQNICHTLKLRVPRVMPTELSLRTVEYFDLPALHYETNNMAVIFLANHWRASLTAVSKKVLVVDEFPTQLLPVETWLQRRLINAFSVL